MSSNASSTAPPFYLWLLLDGCRYHCTACEQVFKSRASISEHAVDAHGMQWEAFLRRYPDTRIRTEWVECEEEGCGMRVPKDREEMRLHLVDRHSGMPLEEYYDKHVAKANDENGERFSIIIAGVEVLEG